MGIISSVRGVVCIKIWSDEEREPGRGGCLIEGRMEEGLQHCQWWGILGKRTSLGNVVITSAILHSSRFTRLDLSWKKEKYYTR